MRPNDYTSLQGWMYDMGLNLSEIITYAVIYGFSWDGHSCYRGTVEQIGEFCQVKRRQARDILARLEQRGLITRKEVPGKITEYAVVLPVPRSVVVNPGAQLPPAVDCPLPGSGLPTTPAVDCRPNINRNNTEFIDTHSSPRAREDGKTLFGEHVLLTPAEHAKLVHDYGTEDTARLIEILDLWLANQRKDPYKSHYAAIRKWCVRDLAEQKTAEQRLKNAQEAAQRVSGQQPMYSGYGAAGLAATKRLEELLKKN
jgi:hypothetical protein